MKKLVIFVFLFLGIGSGIVLGQKVFYKPEQTDPKISAITAVVKDNREEAIPAKPVELEILKLNLKGVLVEYVGLDKEGKMDVPKNSDNVAWFDLGFRPGKKGNAVLAGHFDKETGDPAVFYNLNLLETGDRISLEDENGEVKIFEVKDKKLYSYNAFPTEFVFGKSERRMLNLITCDGTWDSVSKNYSNRLVVFTELIE
ncbi:class F sortase [Candidatus Roizmanbacteria bacterium]|nr:class F sortase [Candidatus Roizmanbacteria bacterium]